MTELRRSGRFKSKGKLVEENTFSDAYSVDDESSGDDFVDGNGKGFEVGNLVLKRSSGSNAAYSTGADKENIQKVKMTKGESSKASTSKQKNIQKVKMTKGESSKASTSKQKKRKGKKPYTFQTRTSPKTLYNAIVTLKPIQKARLARIGFAGLLDFKVDGIPSKLGFYVANNFSEDSMEIKLENGSIVITNQLIGEMLGIRNEGVDIMAEENKKDDEMLEHWAAQFTQGKDITPSYLKCLIRKSDVADMNFKLNFIVLFTSVMGMVKQRGQSDLSVLYKISRNTDLANINWCEYVFSCLKKCKAVWNPTLSNSFFRGPITCLAQYRASLHYSNGGHYGEGCSGVHTDNTEEPQPLRMLQETVDNNSEHFFEMGVSTQKEVFEMVDKAVEEFHSSRKGKGKAHQSEELFNDFEPPSFSLTQDFPNTQTFETPRPDTNTHIHTSAHRSEPIKAVPLSICKPVLKEEDAVEGRAKRKYTKALAARSPYMSRVTDIDTTESKEEKKVATFLLNKIGIDQSVVLFENETGTKASRKQMESLVNGEDIDNGVVDAWSERLNSLESFRAETSMSRFFLPTFIVDKKAFGMESKAISAISTFLLTLEKKNASLGRNNMINNVDLVSIPVSNYGHKFLVCINLKFPSVNMIDSKANHKSVMVTNTNDLVVASLLHQGFCHYLTGVSPSKARALLKVQVTREDLYWQTDKRPNDSGVFLMRHMEAYMGDMITKWSCGLETEGRKQNLQLCRLRKRYATRLLFSDCNLHTASVRAQLEGTEVAHVPAKKMKLPRKGK